MDSGGSEGKVLILRMGRRYLSPNLLDANCRCHCGAESVRCITLGGIAGSFKERVIGK
jgi:hypothetical protein